MSTTKLTNPALRRKIGAERRAPEYGSVSPERALRLALSRAAQEALRLPLSASEISEARATLSALPDLVPDSALLLVLRGPRGARGLAALDPALFASVVEVQTCGRLGGAPVSPRAATATDALLCSGLLSRLLAGLAAALAGHPLEDTVTGFVPGDRLPSLRLLPHALPDTAYKAFEASVDIGNGQRRGRLLLALPWEVPALPVGAGEAAGGDAAALAWSASLGARVMDSEAGLDAVLCRLRLPLSRVIGLAPGDVIPVPARAVAELALEAPGGAPVGVWRLGQAEGMKAVRMIAEDPISARQATAPAPQAAAEEPRSLPERAAAAAVTPGPPAVPQAAQTLPVPARNADAALRPNPEYSDLPELSDEV